jgi:hypothetical protein
MPDSLLTQLGVASVVVAILLAGMKWMATQYTLMQTALTNQQKSCEEREAKLTARIQSVEDRQNSHQTQLLSSAVHALGETAEALKFNAKAMDQFAQNESGAHRARNT